MNRSVSFTNTVYNQLRIRNSTLQPYRAFSRSFHTPRLSTPTLTTSILLPGHNKLAIQLISSTPNHSHPFSSTPRTMSLGPKFSAQTLSLVSSSTSSPALQPHSLEFYLDYVCPFSAKQFLLFYDQVVPLIKQKYTSPGVNVIFRQQIQPWHPSSTLVHEAGVAVARLAPGKFWEFSKALMEKQKEYFDVNVVNEVRNDTYKRLAKLAAETTGVDEAKYFDLLKISDKPDKDGGLNTGNQVTNDLKYQVKANRMTGVHVTPTVVFNGTMENSISSSWTKEQWEEWLEKNVK